MITSIMDQACIAALGYLCYINIFGNKFSFLKNANPHISYPTFSVTRHVSDYTSEYEKNT